MSTPKIILICEGGVIQQVISNTKIQFVNLDYDIFRDGPPENNPDYKSRNRSTEVDVYSEKKFKKIEDECRDEWNAELAKSLKTLEDE